MVKRKVELPTRTLKDRGYWFQWGGDVAKSNNDANRNDSGPIGKVEIDPPNCLGGLKDVKRWSRGGDDEIELNRDEPRKGKLLGGRGTISSWVPLPEESRQMMIIIKIIIYLACS